MRNKIKATHLHNAIIPVSECIYSNTRAEVQVLSALYVPDERAFALSHVDGRPSIDGQDVRMRAVEQLLDGRGDRGRVFRVRDCGVALARRTGQ